MEKVRDEVKAEAQVAWLAVVVTAEVKSLTEEEPARAKGSLVVSKEAKRKVEAKANRLEVERTSFMLDIEAVKDECLSPILGGQG